MYVSPADLPASGWLTAGDPGPFPPVDDEPELSDGPCVRSCCAPAVDGDWAAPGVPQVAAPSPLLADLTRAVDALAGHGPLSGSAADTRALLRLAEQARALAVRELGELDATGGYQQPTGQVRTAASWLRDTQHLTDSAARSAVRLARELREDLPEVAELLGQGRITVEHAAAVADGVRGLDGELVRGAGDGLAALALVTDPTDLRRRLRDKAAAIDDRLTADAERRAHARQHLHLSQVGAHTAVQGTLAGPDGATVRLAMALAVEAARTDTDLRGTAARQADVFVQWANDYLQRRTAGDSLADDAHTVRSHLLISCTPDQLTTTGTGTPGTGEQPGPSLGELLQRDLARGLPTTPASPSIVGSDHPLSRAALRRLACDATLTLTVLRDTSTRDTSTSTCPAGCAPRPGRLCEHLTQPLYVGRSARTISGRQFTALVVRDRRCVVRGCSRPPAQCAGHHVQHWADGGPTDLDNLVLLCHAHHHDLHDRGLHLPHHDGHRWLTQNGWSRPPP